MLKGYQNRLCRTPQAIAFENFASPPLTLRTFFPMLLLYRLHHWSTTNASTLTQVHVLLLLRISQTWLPAISVFFELGFHCAVLRELMLRFRTCSGTTPRFLFPVARFWRFPYCNGRQSIYGLLNVSKNSVLWTSPALGFMYTTSTLGTIQRAGFPICDNGLGVCTF